MARLLRRSIQLSLLASLTWTSPAQADPPGRVARVSFLTGSVSFRPSSLSDWTDASLNYPLTIGDHIWSDVNARTELELGAMTVRLAPLSECSISTSTTASCSSGLHRAACTSLSAIWDVTRLLKWTRRTRLF